MRECGKTKEPNESQRKRSRVGGGGMRQVEANSMKGTLDFVKNQSLFKITLWKATDVFEAGMQCVQISGLKHSLWQL